MQIMEHSRKACVFPLSGRYAASAAAGSKGDQGWTSGFGAFQGKAEKGVIWALRVSIRFYEAVVGF